jgi:cytochrome c-type biogenesis protein
MKYYICLIIAATSLHGCESKNSKNLETKIQLEKVESKENFKAKERAPDFELPYKSNKETVNLDNMKLSAFYGKPIILNFWATWCTPCIKEMPSLEKLKNIFGDKVHILTVNTDPENTKEKVLEFISKNNYTFGVFFDPELYTIEQYGVSGFPETFILDSEGKFLEINDPEAKETNLRIISDRKWDSKEMISAIELAINHKDSK